MKVMSDIAVFRIPQVVGILNVTPDSFYDGGKFDQRILAVQHVKKLIEEGADILDIGGESSRPGAKPISTEIEINRVIPIIREIRKRSSIPISIDTVKSKVAKAALENGASMVNDISGLEHDPKMIDIVHDYQVPIIVMHMRGTPESMQHHPNYANVVEEILVYFKRRVNDLLNRGVLEKNIILDPGIGFGKTIEHNITILNHLDKFLCLKLPIMIGASRKSFIGKILNETVENRLEGTLAVAALAYRQGVSYLRVHDVLEHRRFLKCLAGLEA